MVKTGECRDVGTRARPRLGIVMEHALAELRYGIVARQHEKRFFKSGRNFNHTLYGFSGSAPIAAWLPVGEQHSRTSSLRVLRRLALRRAGEQQHQLVYRARTVEEQREGSKRAFFVCGQRGAGEYSAKPPTGTARTHPTRS